MPKSLDVDVVIIGAGPTGLMLANCLLKLGVSSVLLDGKSEPTLESRALVHQARTMEIYDQLGMVDRVLAQAEVASEIVPGFEDRRFGSINLQRLATGVTPYPHLYILEQSKTERLLVENLEHLGGQVYWSHPLRQLRVTEDGRIECDDRRCARSAWCVRGTAWEQMAVPRSCGSRPGSRSKARQMTTPSTSPTPRMSGDYPRKSINLRFGVRDFLLAFPMGNEADQRLLGVVRGSADAVTETSTKQTLQRVFGVTYPESRWFSTYHVHHRVAAQFRRGPVFLAGDAAHVHSPVGAQGMNTGLQDAHNLACKINDVLTGVAAENYLDRYGAERRPVAQRLVSTTDAMFGVITSDRTVPRLIRSSVVRYLAPFVASFVPRLVRSSRIFEYLSQTRIHYWMSEGARRASHGRRGKVVGRRLPWNGDNYDSLRAMTWQLHAYGRLDRRRVKRLARQLDLPFQVFPLLRNRKIRAGICYLVRPDGFVAVESPLDAAAENFSAHLRMIADG